VWHLQVTLMKKVWGWSPELPASTHQHGSLRLRGAVVNRMRVCGGLLGRRGYHMQRAVQCRHENQVVNELALRVRMCAQVDSVTGLAAHKLRCCWHTCH
jgi:hypothetical protein